MFCYVCCCKAKYFVFFKYISLHTFLSIYLYSVSHCRANNQAPFIQCDSDLTPFSSDVVLIVTQTGDVANPFVTRRELFKT